MIGRLMVRGGDDDDNDDDDDDSSVCALRGSRGRTEAAAAARPRMCGAGDHTLTCP